MHEQFKISHTEDRPSFISAKTVKSSQDPSEEWLLKTFNPIRTETFIINN